MKSKTKRCVIGVSRNYACNKIKLQEKYPGLRNIKRHDRLPSKEEALKLAAALAEKHGCEFNATIDELDIDPVEPENWYIYQIDF